MKQLLIFCGLFCLVAMLLPACAPPPEPEPEAAPEPVFDQAAEEAAIRQLIEQDTLAFNNHDAQAMAAHNTEYYETWEHTRQDRAAFEKMWAEMFKSQKDIQQKELEVISITFVTPNVAIYKSRYEEISRLDADGEPLPPRKLLGAVVLVKKNGKWMFSAGFQRDMVE